MVDTEFDSARTDEEFSPRLRIERPLFEQIMYFLEEREENGTEPAQVFEEVRNHPMDPKELGELLQRTRQFNEGLSDEIQGNTKRIFKDAEEFYRKIVYSKDIGALNLDDPTERTLRRAGFHTVGALIMSIAELGSVQEIAGVGEKTAPKIRKSLRGCGFEVD